MKIRERRRRGRSRYIKVGERGVRGSKKYRGGESMKRQPRGVMYGHGRHTAR